jgi:hypothetical protein
MQYFAAFNLETSVGRRKDVQDIDVASGFKNCVVTLLVISRFLNLLGASPKVGALRRELVRTSVIQLMFLGLCTWPLSAT